MTIIPSGYHESYQGTGRLVASTAAPIRMRASCADCSSDSQCLEKFLRVNGYQVVTSWPFPFSSMPYFLLNGVL